MYFVKLHDHECFKWEIRKKGTKKNNKRNEVESERVNEIENGEEEDNLNQFMDKFFCFWPKVMAQ